MKVIQIIVNLVYGDGMSNCLFFVKRLLDACGIPNEALVGSYLDPRVAGKGITNMEYVLDYGFAPDDIVIYHYGTGSRLNTLVERIPCRKILIFQNVTPPEFFRDWNYEAYATCAAAYSDIEFTAGTYMHAITPSEFSKRILMDYGWKADDISVFPLYELPDIDKAYDTATFERFNDNGMNILFTGRIAPNKKTEDIIRIFNFYNRNYDADSRLILIGSGSPESYKEAVVSYIEEHGIKNVVLTGHISDEERNAIYKAADVFLCMSEHEGFCIPVLEAFQRKIPVIAYKATAVPDTMGTAGILVDTKDPDAVCKEIDKLVHDEVYRKQIVEGQLKRLPDMTLSAHKDEFIQLLQHIEETDIMDKNGYEEDGLKIPHPKVAGQEADSSPVAATTPATLPPVLKDDSLPKEVEEIIAEIVLGLEASGKNINCMKDMIKAELKDDLKNEIKAELKGELKNEIKAELNNEMRSKLVFSSFRKDMLVLYGIGKIGQAVFNDVRESFNCTLVAVCDNSYPEKQYGGVPVYMHDDCIKKFPTAKYLITVQRGYLKIFKDLQESGINGSDIYFYDNVRKRIESAW